jgi:DNA (cytosine-5)-methyltransferase 1
LENVAQILNWSPLVAKRCKQTGRVIKLDGSVAAKGEVTPIDDQFLVPDKKRKGRNWQHFVSGLRKMGYHVEWRNLCAADYGAPTTRDRLYLIARCDGLPLTWPEPSHHKQPKRGQKQWRAAAECIDWSIEGKSIFDRPKPLAEATMKRVAKGVQRYVLDTASPFIVPIANYGSGEVVQDINEPLRTITAWPKGGSFSLVTASLTTLRKNSVGTDLSDPVPVVTAGGTHHGVVTAYMAQMNGGFNKTPGHDVNRPMTTVTNTGSQQQVVTAHLMRQFGNSVGQSLDQPAPTIVAGGGGKTALVECELSQEDESKALRVAAFLINYYGNGTARNLSNPLDTITTKDRLALVTVHLEGVPHVITDIKLRMLQPRELYLAQGFPISYIISHGHDGRKFTKTAQVKMCGNSVSPLPMRAIVAGLHAAQLELEGVA